MDYGYAQNYGNFYYNPDGHISGSLPALNIDTNTLSDGFTWSEYLAAKTYTDGLYISGMSHDGHCVYKEQPDPTAAPTGYDTSVTVASAVVMNGLDPDDFNAKTDMKTAFRKTIASIIQSDEICPGGAADYETCIGEPVATLVRRRRRLLSVSATVDFDMYASVEGSTGAVTAGDDILADVTTALSTSVSDGSFSSTLTAEAAATGGDASTGFASAAIDVTASTTAISASTVAIVVDTPLPTPNPTAAPSISPAPTLSTPAGSKSSDDDDGGAVVIIIVVVVLVVVLAAGAGAFFMMKKGGGAGVKPAGSYRSLFPYPGAFAFLRGRFPH
ncbi:hypothetical protein JL720_5454 [Aureococcus anophagefferens]|nr:hypothetical protein JL720_5454 [Aureococcus anophagefferens]